MVHQGGTERPRPLQVEYIAHHAVNKQFYFELIVGITVKHRVESVDAQSPLDLRWSVELFGRYRALRCFMFATAGRSELIFLSCSFRPQLALCEVLPKIRESVQYLSESFKLNVRIRTFCFEVSIMAHVLCVHQILDCCNINFAILKESFTLVLHH